MVVRMKHSKGKRNRVRSHHKLKAKTYALCSHCGAPCRGHAICANCGWYKGRQVIDVLAKLDKKARKKKESELHDHEREEAARGKELSAKELSHK